MAELFYSAEELRAILGVSKATVFDWAHRGIIPAKQPMGVGGRVLFPKKLVDAWLDELGTDKRPRKKARVAGRQQHWPR